MEAVRLAQPEDHPACVSLLARALDGSASQRGGAALTAGVTPDALLDGWLDAAPGVAVWVGEFHDATVGLAAASTFLRPGAADPTGRVECCYVEEEARGVGVGTALMEAVVEWCTANGCTDVDAQALPGDRATKQRLEAAGFTARLLTLNRRLR